MAAGGMADMLNIQIDYGLSVEARAAIVERFGPMMPGELRAHFAVPNLGYVAQLGDTLRWEVIGDITFQVKHRCHIFSVDGSSMRMALLLDIVK